MNSHFNLMLFHPSPSAADEITVMRNKNFMLYNSLH